MSNPYGSPYAQSFPPVKYGPPPQENTLGLVGFVVSLLGLFVCAAAPIGLILSLAGLRREPKALAVAGTIIGGITTLVYGVIAVLYGAIVLAMIAACVGLGVAAQPVAQTAMSLNEARQQIQNFKGPDGTYPGDAEGNGIIAGKADFWQTPLRYEPQGKGFVIRSAGADKQFNTTDDMTVDDFGSSFQTPEMPADPSLMPEANEPEFTPPPNLEVESQPEATP